MNKIHFGNKNCQLVVMAIGAYLDSYHYIRKNKPEATFKASEINRAKRLSKDKELITKGGKIVPKYKDIKYIIFALEIIKPSLYSQLPPEEKFNFDDTESKFIMLLLLISNPTQRINFLKNYREHNTEEL